MPTYIKFLIVNNSIKWHYCISIFTQIEFLLHRNVEKSKQQTFSHVYLDYILTAMFLKMLFFYAGVPPQDQRGKHDNRPHAFSTGQVNMIINHISSFRGRQSHYSRKETRKFYLPEELNIAKMHRMYLELHPNEKCCYESYRYVHHSSLYSPVSSSSSSSY